MRTRASVMSGIYSKKEFYRLAKQGRCGNTPRQWAHLDDYINDRSIGRAPYLIGIRSTSRLEGLCCPKVAPLPALCVCAGLKSGSYVISEIPPEGVATGRGLQGELSWINGGWYLYYTHDLGYMREKLKESGQHAVGWQVLRLLRRYCSPSEYDELMDLFEKYTDSVTYPTIEFAVFRRPWGQANRCLIIWEIRNGY